MNDSVLEVFASPPKAPATESQAVDAIVAAQRASGDPVDPNGARRLVRALIAVGLFKPA